MGTILNTVYEGCLACSKLRHIIYHKHKLLSALKFDMSKTELLRFRFGKYMGRIHLIASQADLDKKKNKQALDRLKTSTVIGFDTESAQKRCGRGCLSLVQLATEDTVVLWRLPRVGNYPGDGFPIELKDILSNSNIKKVGVGTNFDLRELRLQYDVTMKNVNDCQALAQSIGIEKISMVALAAQLLGWRVSKKQQRSQWDCHTLSEEQLVYAATDAWSALLIYKKLTEIIDTLRQAAKKDSQRQLSHESDIDKLLIQSLGLHTLLKRQSHANYTKLMQRKSSRIQIVTVDDIALEAITSKRIRIRNESFPKYIILPWENNFRAPFCEINDCVDNLRFTTYTF